MPQTGKSTYLGAIWDLTQDDRDTSISEIDVRGDRSYLQLLGEKLARLEVIDRTDVDSDEGLRLTVAFARGDPFELWIPDLSGETLRMLVEDRHWHPLLRAAVSAANAVLLFVHPDQVRQPIRTNFMGAIGATGANPAADALRPTPAFEPRMACTSAVLVDAVENILEVVDLHGMPLRMGIVISAWDEVDGDRTPEQWIAQEMPALWEMCRANSNVIDMTIFGVSAQGGRIPDQRVQLLEKGGVLDRSYALDSSGSPVPLSKPLEWAVTNG
jgi:hypothetical protein